MYQTNDQRLSDYQDLTAQQDLSDRHDEMYDAVADNQPIVLKCDTGNDIGNASEFWHPDYGLIKIWDPIYRVNRLYGDSYEYQSAIGTVVVRQGEIKIFAGN